MLYSIVMNPVAFPPGRARTSDVARSDRITEDGEHDGYGAGCLQQGSNSRRTMRQDDVRGGSGQFCRLFTNVVSPASSPARVDPHAATDDPAKLSQALLNAPIQVLKSGSLPVAGTSTPMCRIRLRSCACATSGHPAAAPPSSVMNSRLVSSITSSARASSDLGTSMPSALAVLGLSPVRAWSAPVPAGRSALCP